MSSKVTIIIPVIAINDYIRETIPKILELDWPSFEIIIFPDLPDKKHSWPKTRIIASGKVGPAEKRDLAIKYATGDILAFLDDDAYPEKDWLKKAIKHFNNPTVGAVGGPAVTPIDDDILQKASGAVFESFTGGAKARDRYLSLGEKSYKVDDWPTVNLLVRKDVFSKIGGFDSSFYPGEDTKLCLDIINSGKIIIAEPKAIVYHHRRSSILKHFKQIGNYGLHRGYFAKIYPKTSRKLFYFSPLLFDLYIISFILWPFLSGKLPFLMLYALPLALYLLCLFVDMIIISIRWKNPIVGLVAAPMIFFTHIWYGIRFAQGLVINKLIR